MPDLYLIAHKVRGEPAFDVAYPFEGHDGEDLGWLIPTSGHGAHPYWAVPLRDLGYAFKPDGSVPNLIGPMPPDLPDHYRAPAAPKPPPLTLESLGIRPMQIRRKLG